VKRRKIQTILLLLLAARNLSAAGAFPALLPASQISIDEKAPQDRESSPPSISALIGNYDIKPISFFDNSEIAKSL